jgi:hypothetical protein
MTMAARPAAGPLTLTCDEEDDEAGDEVPGERSRTLDGG